ncbi:MAG: L,D-transpeptidase family protein [Burkholderiales bacterium]
MPRIRILFDSQRLELLDDSNTVLKTYPVSTAEKGPGEEMGSYCTPRGRHVIRAKIGTGAQVNSVFVERRPTGEVFTPELGAQYPDRDWILTRILWLSGLERGFNRGGSVDSMRRYIYIHGTPDRMPLGRSGSKGCIRMRNADIIELFDLVPPGTEVEILA